MRAIYFRGKRMDNGSWICGSLRTISQTRAKILPFGLHLMDVDPATVGQYTGLKDKDGKQIFEGDIVRTEMTGGTYQGFSWGDQQVVFKDAAFCLSDALGRTIPLCSFAPSVSFEIVGNVHDACASECHQG